MPHPLLCVLNLTNVTLRMCGEHRRHIIADACGSLQPLPPPSLSIRELCDVGCRARLRRSPLSRGFLLTGAPVVPKADCRGDFPGMRLEGFSVLLWASTGQYCPALRDHATWSGRPYRYSLLLGTTTGKKEISLLNDVTCRWCVGG